MPLKHVNAVVVGAGAGGGVVAKELSQAGLTVALLERGRWPEFEEHDHDELLSQRVTVLGNAFGPDDRRHRRVVAAGNGAWRVVLPSEGAYNNNAACVGSGTVSYGAMAWRFMEKDFRLRSAYRAVAGSTLEDWPLTYQDLEPGYEKAEWEIGVAGEHGADPFAAPRRRPYPMPPFPHNKEGRVLEAAARDLNWHPFPIPMLRNSVPYAGRPACIQCRYCVGFACEVNAKCGTHNTPSFRRPWRRGIARCGPSRSRARSWSTIAGARAGSNISTAKTASNTKRRTWWWFRRRPLKPRGCS